jgi:hypothetical protein
MKKWVVLLMMIVLVGCSSGEQNDQGVEGEVGEHSTVMSQYFDGDEYTGFNDLQLGLSQKAYGELNYVVLDGIEVAYNIDRLHQFVDDSLEGEYSRVRLVSFYDSEGPYFRDVLFNEDGYSLFYYNEESFNEEPYEHLLVLDGYWGSPSRYSREIVLSDNPELTFDEVNKALVSSDMNYIESVGRHTVVIFNYTEENANNDSKGSNDKITDDQSMVSETVESEMSESDVVDSEMTSQEASAEENVNLEDSTYIEKIQYTYDNISISIYLEEADQSWDQEVMSDVREEPISALGFLSEPAKQKITLSAKVANLEESFPQEDISIEYTIRLYKHDLTLGCDYIDVLDYQLRECIEVQRTIDLGKVQDEWIIEEVLSYIGTIPYVEVEINKLMIGERSVSIDADPFTYLYEEFLYLVDSPHLRELLGFTRENVSRFITGLDPWNPVKEFPMTENIDSETSSEIVKDVLETYGVSSELSFEILQNLLIDIDNDGIDETIILAEREPKSVEDQEPFSMLCVSQVIDGERITQLAINQYEPVSRANPIAYRSLELVHIIDGKEDGILELICQYTVDEVIQYEVYELVDNELILTWAF